MCGGDLFEVMWLYLCACNLSMCTQVCLHVAFPLHAV